LEFSEFGLHPDLLDGIDALNFKNATPIQEKAIPLILEGKDLIGIAQTGTGKTAAFILPILDLILKAGEARGTQALVVVPTRELAMQIDKVVEAYSYFIGVTSCAVYGGGDGKDFARERAALVSGAEIIIATPGRLISHLNLGYVDFSNLRFFVLDEADRMLDMGFQPDIQTIVGKLPKVRQSLLFSATMPPMVLKLARTLLHNPDTISIALSKPAEGVTQGAYLVSDQQKLPLIVDLLRNRTGQRILVFSSTKSNVGVLYQKLRAKNLNVGQISSDLEQDAREKMMQDFRNRTVDILVATDVVSRGIDIDGIDLVINYDIPRDAEDYVHRVGRTARAARKGTALTFVSPTDQVRFKRIEALIGASIEKLPLPDSVKQVAPEGRDRPRSSGRRPEKNTRPTHAAVRTEKQPRAEKQPRPAETAMPDAQGETPAQPQVKKKKRRNRHRGGKGRGADGDNQAPKENNATGAA
jgi:ATP-dependent RNA helicase RhlE